MVVHQLKQCEGILGQKALVKQAAGLKPLLFEENEIQVLMKNIAPGITLLMPWKPPAPHDLKLLALVGVFALQLVCLYIGRS